MGGKSSLWANPHNPGNPDRSSEIQGCIIGLYRSTDGGATWTTAETYGDGGIGFNDLGFTTATQGVVIHGLPGPPADFASQLLMTTDGGATWAVMPIA